MGAWGLEASFIHGGNSGPAGRGLSADEETVSIQQGARKTRPRWAGMGASAWLHPDPQRGAQRLRLPRRTKHLRGPAGSTCVLQQVPRSASMNQGATQEPGQGRGQLRQIRNPWKPGPRAEKLESSDPTSPWREPGQGGPPSGHACDPRCTRRLVPRTGPPPLLRGGLRLQSCIPAPRSVGLQDRQRASGPGDPTAYT